MADTEIKVYDNFFEQSHHKKILEVLSKPMWSFSGGHPDVSVFWHMDELEKDDFFSVTLYNLICEKIGKKFKIKRIYANGQTAGQSGVPHFDDGDWTFLYYPNMNWNVTLGGCLFFLESDGYQVKEDCEIIKAVSYKENRAVLFPSSLPHFAEAPSRFYNDIRMSVAWKFLEK